MLQKPIKPKFDTSGKIKPLKPTKIRLDPEKANYILNKLHKRRQQRLKEERKRRAKSPHPYDLRLTY